MNPSIWYQQTVAGIIVLPNFLPKRFYLSLIALQNITPHKWLIVIFNFYLKFD